MPLFLNIVSLTRQELHSASAFTQTPSKTPTFVGLPHRQVKGDPRQVWHRTASSVLFSQLVPIRKAKCAAQPNPARVRSKLGQRSCLLFMYLWAEQTIMPLARSLSRTMGLKERPCPSFLFSSSSFMTLSLHFVSSLLLV